LRASKEENAFVDVGVGSCGQTVYS
jgi:hypothetical protein